MAQRTPDPGNELELIESTERSEDPLGIDESTGTELDRAAARLPQPKPVVSLPSPSQGAALSSISGVRESAHEVHVELDQGLAFVSVKLTISSMAKHAAELAYRLPLPRTAVVTRVQTCVHDACSDAAPEPRAIAAKPRAGPALTAESIEDARGPALALRVAPIAAGSTLTIQLQYVAEAAWHAGRARFRLEPRGYDPNLAPSDVTLSSKRLAALQPAAALSIDPWSALELSASLPPAAPSVRDASSSACGAGRCLRSFEASAQEPAIVRPTWLMIDASPSMEGPARGRMGVVLAALLTLLPEATDLRAYAFAARATELGRFRAAAAPLTQLADASMLDLDAATQPSAALALVRTEIARIKPRIVVLSDGLFDGNKRERDALLRARGDGADTWLLALGNTRAQLTDAFSHTLELARLSEAALHGSDLSALEDALSALVAPTSAAGLLAGEQRVREQRPKLAWPLSSGAPWLAFWLRRDRPVSSFRSEPSSDSTPLVAAIPYLSLPPAPPVADTGLPKESVLTMLRTQLVPQARACLRSDRKGRANYAVGLSFHALFAQREVYDAEVVGSIPRELRGCLEAILPKLRVPAFSGRIRIRYPIYTEREEEPPVIELEPEVRQQLERAFSRAPALP